MSSIYQAYQGDARSALIFATITIPVSMISLVALIFIRATIPPEIQYKYLVRALLACREFFSLKYWRDSAIRHPQQTYRRLKQRREHPKALVIRHNPGIPPPPKNFKYPGLFGVASTSEIWGSQTALHTNRRFSTTSFGSIPFRRFSTATMGSARHLIRQRATFGGRPPIALPHYILSRSTLPSVSEVLAGNRRSRQRRSESSDSSRQSLQSLQSRRWRNRLVMVLGRRWTVGGQTTS